MRRATVRAFQMSVLNALAGYTADSRSVATLGQGLELLDMEVQAGTAAVSLRGAMMQ